MSNTFTAPAPLAAEPAADVEVFIRGGLTVRQALERAARLVGVDGDPRAALHMPTGQTYNGRDFVTGCTCGSSFVGLDPDHADAEQGDHAAAELGENPPAPIRGARRGARDFASSDDYETTMADALTDLMHFATVAGIDFAAALGRAQWMHDDETVDPT